MTAIVIAVTGLALNFLGLLVALWKLNSIEKRHADELAVTKHEHEMMWRQFVKEHGLNGERDDGHGL